jgi:CheY-like chemotaxis protein
MPKPIAFVIEDDPQLCQIMSITLEGNFDVHAISNGNEALSRLANEIPRIIILDLNLPGVSGDDILSYIRADERLKQVSVILCTANERLADSLRDEADLILLKPVSPIQLQEIASRLK